MSGTAAQPPSHDETQLAAAIALVALRAVAPEEVPIFEETASEYFRDPARATSADHRDRAVGFGLDLALITPFLLSMASATVGALVTMARDAVTQEGAEALGSVMRKLLRPGQGAAHPASLNVDQARRLRDVAQERGRALGLSEQRAAVLADAVVGGMVVSD